MADLKQNGDEEKTAALFVAAKAENFELLKKLIADGADPLATTSTKDQNLLHILYNRLYHTLNNDKMLQIIKYILNLPQYKELNDKCEAIYHNILLLMAHQVPLISSKFELVAPMIKLILKTKNINNLVFEDKIKMCFSVPQDIKMNPTALFIFHLMKADKVLDDKKLKTINRMLELGFILQETQGCVTPLTILFLNLSKLNYSDCDIGGQILEKVVKKFEESGVNIESSVLSPGNLSWKHYVERNTLKIELLVPDVLYLAMLQNAKQWVWMFLRNWWGPPLALLYFSNPLHWNSGLSCFFYEFSTQYGAIPHGTKIVAQLDRIMEDVIKNVSLDPDEADDAAEFCHYYYTYKELQASPMSLTDLSKYAVRRVLAQRAAQSDVSLPTLLKQSLTSQLYNVAIH